MPVTTGTGGQTKYNRIRLGLQKTHWLDAACVGVTETLQVLTERILHVTATGFGGRQRCQTDKYGYPVKHRPLHPIFGFCTGDIVRADVPLCLICGQKLQQCPDLGRDYRAVLNPAVWKIGRPGCCTLAGPTAQIFPSVAFPLLVCQLLQYH